jgi:hypothetical protein
MTSSGLRSAELPLDHTSCDRRLAKMDENASGVVCGGMPEVSEIGRCREKNVERVRSGAVVSGMSEREPSEYTNLLCSIPVC